MMDRNDNTQPQHQYRFNTQTTLQNNAMAPLLWYTTCMFLTLMPQNNTIAPIFQKQQSWIASKDTTVTPMTLQQHTHDANATPLVTTQVLLHLTWTPPANTGQTCMLLINKAIHKQKHPLGPTTIFTSEPRRVIPLHSSLEWSKYTNKCHTS